MKILICLLLTFHVSSGMLRPANDTTEELLATENSTTTTTSAPDVPSFSIDSDPQQLFSSAVSALIDEVKTKLSGSIAITLSDAVVNAITAPESPAVVRKNTKVKAESNKSPVQKANGPANRKRPAQKPNVAVFGASGKSELLEASEAVDEAADEESEPAQIDDDKSAVGKSELLKASEANDEEAKDNIEPAKIDDAKSAAVEKSDDQQRLSRQRKQSSKKPNLERQAEASNAVMVGLNDIAVDEVAFKKGQGPRNRAVVTIKSISGPIRILLSSNSSQVQVATYSISAPIVINIGPDNIRTQNEVVQIVIRKNQVKTKDLKVDDALKNKPGTRLAEERKNTGIILAEINRILKGANFDQLLKEAFTAALQEESVLKKFIDASNSNFTRKQTKVV